MRGVRRPIEAGNVVEGLGGLMTGWKETALGTYSTPHGWPLPLMNTMLISSSLASYDTAASRYHKAVYTKKRADLVTTIHTTLHPLFYSQLKSLSKLTLARFKKTLTETLKADASYDFAEVVSRTKVDGLKKWEESTKEMLAVVKGDAEAGIGGAEWVGGWEEERGLLETEIGHVADIFRKDETTKMVNNIEVSFNNELYSLPARADYVNSEHSELRSRSQSTLP